MSSNIHLKKKAFALRRKGKSYNDIRKALGIKSKGTLSHWFSNLKLSKKSEKLLGKNKLIAHKRGLFTANKERSARIKDENGNAYTYGKNSIPSLSKKDLLLIGTALYWAEGLKSEKTGNLSLTFSNSDPSMVIVYIKFVREILKIPEERIRAGIHIYPSIIPTDARKFWSVTTGLPEERFYIVTQVSRASQGKRPFNILPHGTVAIKINSRVQFHKVKGMMHGIIEKASKI